jgi:hypothetical protein
MSRNWWIAAAIGLVILLLLWLYLIGLLPATS